MIESWFVVLLPISAFAISWLPGTEGGVTTYLPTGEQMSIYDAAMKYQANHIPLIVLAGAEYGTGSSRDWAAKGTYHARRPSGHRNELTSGFIEAISSAWESCRWNSRREIPGKLMALQVTKHLIFSVSTTTCNPDLKYSCGRPTLREFRKKSKSMFGSILRSKWNIIETAVFSKQF